MKKSVKLSLITVATLLLSSISYANNSSDAKEAKSHSEHKHWGYSGDVSPAHWGELDEKFKMCAEGKQQSPIDVLGNKDVDLKDLKLNYGKSCKSLIDNGHAIQVNIESGSIFDIDGVAYELKQFHLHTPSENHIKGVSYPMEAHFVHATKDGKLAVLAVMFEEGENGEESPIMAEIIKSFPLKVGKDIKFSASSEMINNLLPKDKGYYKFMGSLTTPPCSEQVKWFVLKSPKVISKGQIDAIHKQLNKENNRPVQPTNGREIDK